jgi:hypothetical protein
MPIWNPVSEYKAGRKNTLIPIEIDTLEYQQTEKIETELKDVDRIQDNPAAPSPCQMREF